METETKPKLRWFHLTPGRLLVVLLVVEGILFLSEKWIPKGWSVLIAIAAVGLFLPLMLLWFIVSLIFRCHFQFSIRSLLVLTVIVAILCSWMTVEMKKAREQKEVLESLVNLDGGVKYDYEFDTSGNLTLKRPPPQPPAPVWIREQFGDDFFIDATMLYFKNSQASDVALEHLMGLPRLQWVDLSYSQIGDAALDKLKGLPKLVWLNLRNTQINDDGVKHIANLTQLQWLNLRNTKISNAGVAKLQKALPNCRIEH